MNGAGEPAAGEEIQRWTAGRKAAVVMDVIKGKATPAANEYAKTIESSRRLGLQKRDT